MFVRTFGAAEDQKNKVHGYRQRVNDDGDDGYKHFDSFHKKNGDKYGYETFSSYGIHEHGAKEGGDAHSGAESKKEECKLIIGCVCLSSRINTCYEVQETVLLFQE